MRFNTRFASAQQDEKGVAIRVVSKDDHEQTLQARYLIGADGVRSMVRDTIGAKMEGRYGISHHYNLIFHAPGPAEARSEEHTSELQSLMRISHAVFCLKKKNPHQSNTPHTTHCPIHNTPN